MKKFFTIFILLIIIAVSGVFSYSKISAQRNERNFFNDNARHVLARYPFFRSLLGLHFDGDARSEYLGKNQKTILLKVIPMQGLSVDEQTLSLFAQKIEGATGKSVRFLRYPAIPYVPSVSLEELQKNVLQEDYFSSSPDAVLYVLIASQKEGDNDNLGSTLKENGIVIFENTLKKNMRNDSADTIDTYTASLLLHEFGHQIGLDHNTVPDCLMNEKTEFSDTGTLFNKINYFCDSEQQEIKEMRF